MLVPCMAYSSTLNMEATCSSGTLIDFYWTTRRYIPEDRALYNHVCENLKSYKTNEFTNFRAVFEETGSSYSMLLLHTGVRWFSGSCIHSRPTLRILLFSVDYPAQRSSRLCDTVLLYRLAYLADIYTNIIELNLYRFRVRLSHLRVSRHMRKSESFLSKTEFWSADSSETERLF
jgi:hypothetical protein